MYSNMEMNRNDMNQCTLQTRVPLHVTKQDALSPVADSARDRRTQT